MTEPLMETPQRRHIPGPTPDLDTWVSVGITDGSAIYTLEQGENAVILTHEMSPLVAAELMAAHDEEERRQQG